MQAIFTKYIGPTNFRGSRVKASCEAKSIYLSWDDTLNSEQNHDMAAKELATQLDWHGQWYSGGLENGNVYVCVTNWQGNFEKPTFLIEKPAKAA